MVKPITSVRSHWWATFRGGPHDGLKRRVSVSAATVRLSGDLYELVAFERSDGGWGRLIYCFREEESR